MSNLQPNCCLFKFDFQKVDQHAGGKWLIIEDVLDDICYLKRPRSIRSSSGSWVDDYLKLNFQDDVLH